MRTLREFRQILRQARQDHALRHRPSRFGIALFDSIHHAPREDWEAVVPDSRLFLRPVYLAALEDSGAEALRHRYALLYDGRRPVAAAAMQILDFSGESLGSRGKVDATPGLRGKVTGALRKATERVGVRVLVCGNAFVTGEHGFSHVPDLDPTEAFDGLADAIYRVRRADKLHGQVSGVLVKDFYGGSSPGTKQLTRFGYREFAVDPQMRVVIRSDWRSFDDYVGTMTKKYRSRVRSARKKGATLTRREFTVDEIVARQAEIRALFLAVHDKAKFRIAAVPEGYFAALANALGTNFAMEGYFLEDRLVGFNSIIQWGTRLEAHYLGLDYEFNLAHGIYQNILYDHVAHAIERGCHELLLGRTALEIKSAIGAEPSPVTCYMRHRNPASNAVVKPLFRFVKPTSWTRRNPFG